MAPPDVLHVGVVDLLAEGADELHVVDALVAEVAGVVVEAEALVVADGVERALGGGDVEGDFGRVHFEAEVDVVLLEDLEDGLPALGEIIEALLQVSLVSGREGVNRVPDGGTGEAVDDGLAGTLRLVGHVSLTGVEELAGRLSGQGHLSARALADAFRITITPDVRREDALVAFVDIVADGLADEVRGDGVAGEAVLGQQFPLVLAVVLVAEGGVTGFFIWLKEILITTWARHKSNVIIYWEDLSSHDKIKMTILAILAAYLILFLFF